MSTNNEINSTHFEMMVVATKLRTFFQCQEGDVQNELRNEIASMFRVAGLGDYEGIRLIVDIQSHRAGAVTEFARRVSDNAPLVAALRRISKLL
jgi:hypothetical protein